MSFCQESPINHVMIYTTVHLYNCNIYYSPIIFSSQLCPHNNFDTQLGKVMHLNFGKLKQMYMQMMFTVIVYIYRKKQLEQFSMYYA